MCLLSDYGGGFMGVCLRQNLPHVLDYTVNSTLIKLFTV